MNDDSIAVKKNILSKREQEAKQRLMGKQTKQPTPQKNDQQRKQLPQNNQDINQFKKGYDAPSNDQIDKFLIGMEEDFKNISQKQVTMGMLNNQHQIIKQQNEILNENQKQMSQMFRGQQAQHNPYDQQEINKQEVVEANIQMMRQLLQPINEQLRDIKYQYDNTQKTQKSIIDNLNIGKNSGVQDNLNKYSTQNNQLKGMLDTANHDIMFLKPENVQALQTFSNFNLQIYSDTINNLQKQIQGLQHQQEYAEQDLNIKYKQINDVRTNQKIRIYKEAEDETLQEITKMISKIDHQSSKKLVQEKLGGIFDYEVFINDMANFTERAQEIFNNYQDEAKQSEIIIPNFRIDNKDLQALNVKPASILDEIKQQLGMDHKSMALKSKAFSIQEQQKAEPKPTLQSVEQWKNIKPIPQYEAPTQIPSYPKQIVSTQEPIRQTYIMAKPSQRITQPSSQKPREKEKESLVYRSQSHQKQQKQEPKKQYGVLQYTQEKSDHEDDDNQPIWTISDPQSKIKQINNKNSPNKQQQVKPQTQQVDSQQKMHQQEFKQIVSVDPIPSKEQLMYDQQQQYLSGQNQSQGQQFVNYDNMMNDLQKGEYFHTQEPKSDEVLRKLGLINQSGSKSNPNDQNSLIEQISRDLMREKLELMMGQNKEQDEKKQKSAEKMMTNQSTSPLLQPQQAPKQQIQSIQEEATQGVNLLLQGFLQALNTSLAQVNQGMYQNIQNQAPQFMQHQNDNIESSSFSDISDDYPRQPQMKVQSTLNTILGPPQQSYTFAQDFNPNKVKTVNLKEYYKQFEVESESVSQNDSAINKSNRSYGGSIFNIDQSPGKRSEGEVSQVQRSRNLDLNNQLKPSLTKDIFKDLQQDFSDGEIETQPRKRNNQK